MCSTTSDSISRIMREDRQLVLLMSGLATDRTVLAVLYVLRVILCLLPQHGYIQPDEFFQFTEPAADRVLGCQTFLAWELTRSHPIRSMFFPVVVAQSAFRLIRWFTPQPSGYVLLVIPRLLIAISSFICDWTLTVILRDMGRNERQTFWCRLSLASCYVFFTYMTHTFSNSIETVLLSLLLVSVFRSVRSPEGTSSAITGVILSLGFFNRPTFAAFAAVPVLWQVTGAPIPSFDRRRGLNVLIKMSRSFALCSAIMVLWDSSYYTDILVDFWNIPGAEYWDKLVICPLNFIEYNMRTENLSRHGLHPRYLHIGNLFLVLTVLALPLIRVSISVIISLFKSHRMTSGKEGMNQWLVFATVFPVAGLMVFPHQEPRFLIPVTVTACALVGDRLSRKRYLIPWIACNLILTLMYGFIHQAGVSRSLLTLNHMIRTKEIDVPNTSIVFVNMYLPPQHLMNAPKNLPVFDLSVDEYPESLIELLEMERHMNRTAYLVAPSSLDDGIRTMIMHHQPKSLTLHHQYFPHFSGELVMHSWNILMTSGDLTQAFSMKMWKLVSS